MVYHFIQANKNMMQRHQARSAARSHSSSSTKRYSSSSTSTSTRPQAPSRPSQTSREDEAAETRRKAAEDARIAAQRAADAAKEERKAAAQMTKSAAKRSISVDSAPVSLPEVIPVFEIVMTERAAVAVDDAVTGSVDDAVPALEAVSTTLWSGNLSKRPSGLFFHPGSGKGGFKKRHFVLTDQVLMYGDERLTKRDVSSILSWRCLQDGCFGASLSLGKSNKFGIRVAFRTKGRQHEWTLQAETEAARSQFLDALEKAVRAART
mmetsp:Transcript_6900/g.15869  ORF Transcript_6900/g.15869 Transcript_6900/m.15869 type:complete len:265 (+) Transcript_6900:122-916(+)|eukprot:CAMPEP_0114544986 /NCGR_PEP_ID=MMETSP0114-20121206/3163_1 /TAXON_ID=31324 /ORGANISM="Goniomonas sp, Strain m" /LENGTH=264 /DNA_ID=CAMNT_0001729391 /DNA_START=111 /DNA_END=905 /DNA_ORIENTATION=+